jgi:hypothetical protein
MKLPLTSICRALNKIPMPKSIRLTWQAHLTDLIFRKEIADLKISKDRDREKLQRLEFDHQSEISILYEELNALHTNQLIRKARRLRVPVPPNFDKEGKSTGYWEEGPELKLWYLTDKGLTQVREAIYKELEWVYKRREHYTNLITGIIGILGTLIGFIIGSIIK